MVPNCIVKAKADRKREFVADEQAECMDKTGLFYVLPFERGYLRKCSCAACTPLVLPTSGLSNFHIVKDGHHLLGFHNKIHVIILYLCDSHA